MSERNGAQEYLEKKTAEFTAAIPAAVRKAILECVADLADEVTPLRRAGIGERDPEDFIEIDAWDAAIDEFTAHLKETLLLDPKPMVWHDDLRGPMRNFATRAKFAPRPYYSQNPEDYS